MTIIIIILKGILSILGRTSFFSISTASIVAYNVNLQNFAKFSKNIKYPDNIVCTFRYPEYTFESTYLIIYCMVFKFQTKKKTKEKYYFFISKTRFNSKIFVVESMYCLFIVKSRI